MSFRKSLAYLAATQPTTGAVAVVTGAKSGIGAALRQKVAEWELVDTVVAVSRSISEIDVQDDPKCVAVAADIGTREGRKTVVDCVHALCRGTNKDESKQVRFLIHCAGTIDPITPILELQPDAFEKAWQVNVAGPLFLTTALHPYLQPTTSSDSGIAGRVLHVSSGAAHGAPPVGWGTYGITKAAFVQSFRVLEREFRGTGVVVGSFKPGVVDTAMQGVIRAAPSTAMPIVQNFINMKSKANDTQPMTTQVQARPPPSGALDTPANVAFFAEFLLLGTTDEEYANAQDSVNEWDIRDKSHWERWIAPEYLP